VSDNFFALGGHSLLAVRTVAQLSQELGRSVPLALLFSHPIARELAACIDEGKLSSPRNPIALMSDWLATLA
jgi:hypothetical protein